MREPAVAHSGSCRICILNSCKFPKDQRGTLGPAKKYSPGLAKQDACVGVACWKDEGLFGLLNDGKRGSSSLRSPKGVASRSGLQCVPAWMGICWTRSGLSLRGSHSCLLLMAEILHDLTYQKVLGSIVIWYIFGDAGFAP